MREVLLAGLAMLAAHSSYGQPSGNNEPSRLLCIVDFVGGLHYDRAGHVWGVTQFKPGHKYIIRRSTYDDAHGKYADVYSMRNRNKEIGDWLIFDIDSKYPEMAAESCSESNAIPTSPRCSGGYAFDKQTLRFQYTYPGGYMSQGGAQYAKEHPSSFPNDPYRQDAEKRYIEAAEEPDDASFSIGKCAPF